jgi:hypothetical protein
MMTIAGEISLQATPFADEFVDVAALNAHISTYLLDRVESVKGAAQTDETVPSKAIAVLGPAGGGKTHLFSRLSHQSGSRPTLVLLRPYFGVNVTLRDVLAAVIDQLCLPVHGDDRTQLDVIASHWAPEGDVERGVRAVVSLLPEIAPAAHLARTLLELRGREPSTTWADLAWLSGREPRATTADGASASALSEGDVLHVLRIVAVLAAPVAPVVLTFDQLENLAGDDDARVLGYGNLVSEIVDSLPCLTIVQLALTSEWMQYIEPKLSLPQKTRLARETFVIEAPARRERELLLRTWHQRLAPKTPSRRKAPFPSPLSENELHQLLDAPGMTPRLLLAALSRAISGQPVRFEPRSSPRSKHGLTGDDATSDDVARRTGIEALWNAEYERVRVEQADKERSSLPFDAAELAEALTSALGFAPNLAVSHRTERDRVVTSVKAPGHELVLVYLTSSQHGSVAATLTKAAELARGTKVVVVREKRFDFPNTWETVRERRSSFERLPNARWLWLDGEDLARCLTLARLLSKARAKKLDVAGSDEPLSIDRVRDAILGMHAPAEWESAALITRWLSDVPRETVAAAREVQVEVGPAVEARPSSAAALPALPIPASPQASEPAPPPTLRAWLSQGRELGRSAVTRYVQRVRTLVGRD